tara:strand:+ start:901 stop:1230 length:330 start_codon:yes stop_codon:yes gene_type:complete
VHSTALKTKSMCWSKNYFKNLNRTHYELIGGVPWNKLRGIWLDGKLADTNITKEQLINTRKSVPENYWKDYVELMTWIYDDGKTIDECKVKLKEIILRGNIKEHSFQIG